ncbi:response regulator transcription factor [Streptomyces sp. NPDC055025]
MSTAWAVPGVLRQYDLVTLAGLARGHTVADIAAATGTPYGTVRNRVRRIRQRIAAVSCAHAVAIAYQHGWLTGLTAEPRPPVRLTARQRQVLVLMADGLTNSQIASVTGTTPNTVATHIRRLYATLGASSPGTTSSPAFAARCHTIALAYQHGHLLAATPARKAGA